MPNVSKLFLEFCTSLLELDEESDTLSCIHATAKEYLMFVSDEEQLTNPITAHANIANVCLTYLNFEHRGFVDRSEVDLGAIPFSEPWPWLEYLHFPFHLQLEEYKLIQYSAANWPLHFSRLAGVINMTDSVRQCLTALKDLLLSQEKLLRWLEMFHFLATERLDEARKSVDLIDAWIMQYEDAKLGPDFTAHIAETHAFGKFAFAFNGGPMVDTTETDELRKAATLYPSPEIIKHLGLSWSFALDHLGFSSKYGIYRWRRFTRTEPITRKPVHMAAFFDFTDFVEKQLASGVDVNDRCATDRSIINNAAFGESTNTCQLLLKKGADIDQCPVFAFFDGQRPILHALYDDQFKPLRLRDYTTARYLLAAGARVQVEMNPLHPLHSIFDYWAETQAQLDTLKELMDHAEDIVSLLETPSPYHGMTPLQIVARNNLEETVRMILERHPDPRKYASLTWGADLKTSLHEACFAQSSRCGEMLLDTGMDVNIVCAISRSTPLHIAASSRSDMLPKLLAFHANASLADGAGRLPLHLAAIQDWSEAILALAPHTKDLNAKDSQGYTAIALASLHGSRSAVKALLQAGAAQTFHGNGATPSESHQPATSSDVFHTYFLLSCKFNFRASMELVVRIIDNAEYWVRSTTRVVQPFAIQQADAGRPYLVSRPLSMPGTAIRKIHCRISCEAHEGEYTALFPERRSWTWFQLSRKESGGGELVPGPRLAVNDIDIEGRQEHNRAVYATDSTSDIASWLGRLRKGDAVALVPMARWPQRVNTVFEASLEIYSSASKDINNLVVSGERERLGLELGWDWG